MALELVYCANGGSACPLPGAPRTGPGRRRRSSRRRGRLCGCRSVGLCWGFKAHPQPFTQQRCCLPLPCTWCVCVCVCVVCCVSAPPVACPSAGMGTAQFPFRGADLRPKKGGDARLRTPVDSSTGVPDTPTPQNPSGPGGLKQKKYAVGRPERQGASKPSTYASDRTANTKQEEQPSSDRNICGNAPNNVQS